MYREVIMKKLFQKVTVDVIDGDDRLNNSDVRYRDNYRRILTNGMKLYGIQIFHYAAPHYSSRHNRPSMRFLNGLFNGGAAIEIINGKLALNENEGSELQRDSSEIISVGLSNMLMCKWLEIKVNRLSTIESSDKRCDFEFNLGTRKYIYEVRGRKHKSQFNSALNDVILKKANHHADEKLAVICHLPRNNDPVSMHVYDPDVNEGDKNEDVYYVLKHYSKMMSLSGLYIMAEKLEERLTYYRENSMWINEPLSYNEKVRKLVWEIRINNKSYLTLRKPGNLPIDTGYNLHFGICQDLLDIIEGWKLEELLNFEGQEFVDENKGISCLQDGTLMYYSHTSLDKLE